MMGIVLLKPILFPTIIEYPWEEVSRKEDKTVILAGSYNPPHLGHLAMLEYLSKRYEVSSEIAASECYLLFSTHKALSY